MEPAKVYHLSTGEIEDGCARCRALENDLDALQSENLRLLRANTALKRDRDEQRATHPKRAQVLEVFEYWVEQTGKKNSKLSADRFDAVKARLAEGYTVQQIKWATAGAASHPFIVNAQRSQEGTGPKRNDLTLICRGGKQVEELAVLGYVWLKERGEL